MNTDDILNLNALGQARLIASGAVDARTLFDLHQAAIGRYNSSLNAFVAVIDHSDCVPVADKAPELRGVCFAVKDNIDVAGLPSHAGLRALRAGPAAADSPAVARLRSAGLQCLGKLNMHPVALGTTNHNPDFGNAYNPLRTTCTPGGSSGGSGAAVAAGLCGIALGTDTMGSVRIPAAHCGVVGFKPSTGVIPTKGVLPLSTLLDSVGILARGVADVAAAYSLVSVHAGEVATASTRGAAHIPPHANNARTGTQVRGTFAIPANLDALALEAPVRSAFESGIEQLRRHGTRIAPLALDDYPFTRLRRAGLVLCETELLTTLAEPLRERRNEFPADLLAMLDYGATRTGADVARLLAEIVRWGQWMDRELQPFEGLLMPTTAHEAFPMTEPVPHDHADFTAMANMSGGPSISVPLPVAPGCLPVGLQFTGCRGGDLRLLDTAQWIEQILRGESNGN